MKYAVYGKMPKIGRNQAVIVPVFDEDIGKGGKVKKAIPFAQALEDGLKSGAIGQKAGSFHALEGQGMSKREPVSLAFVFLGRQVECNDSFAANAICCAFAAVSATRPKEIVVAWPLLIATASAAVFSSMLCSGMIMTSYRFDKYKSEKGSKATHVAKVSFIAPKQIHAQISQGARKGAILGMAANNARTIANEPANVATPKFVAEYAQNMAKKAGLSCKLLGKKELAMFGMNSMSAVAQGSVQEPVLVVLEYMGAGKGEPFHALVGKGVTFDSGGISIKPSKEMDQMKFDKSGACAVIAAMGELKRLGIKKNVVGIAPLVENLPSGSAYKPGDIVKASNGKTIEVLNTDAEGRMILADALAYAVKNYKPETMMDFATLTGACVVALGDIASGLFSNDEEMAARVEAAAAASGERVWRLPLWREYDWKIKSEVADMKNVGESGQAGSAAGASFLKEFVGATKWAHVDIAGTAWLTKPKNGLCAGATGMGARLALEYLLAL
ncbi:MAG: leucyl aminopeptidase [Candidatus Micrarchaeia archaeon]